MTAGKLIKRMIGEAMSEARQNMDKSNENQLEKGSNSVVEELYNNLREPNDHFEWLWEQP